MSHCPAVAATSAHLLSSAAERDAVFIIWEMINVGPWHTPTQNVIKCIANVHCGAPRRAFFVYVDKFHFSLHVSLCLCSATEFCVGGSCYVVGMETIPFLSKVGSFITVNFPSFSTMQCIYANPIFEKIYEIYITHFITSCNQINNHKLSPINLQLNCFHNVKQ